MDKLEKIVISGAESVCTSRRCLAQMLIKKELKSQPQYENCSLIIEIPLLEYQTLAVDTKNLRLVSRLHATLIWRDPEMSWNTSLYQYEEVSVPVNSVWTPELHVTNAITVTTQPSSKDLVVLSNGTLNHEIILNTEVNCEVNLFNYPFAADACPVAIHTWYSKKCGGKMRLANIKMKDGARGDWQTQSIYYYQKGGNKNFILVDLKIRQNNPFITLMLPSILIIMADVVSAALPLGGGERNSFKVTLVLSFTMFLVILNEELPGDNQCSPLIKSRPDISVVQTEPAEEHIQMLRKVVSFIQALDAKKQESDKYERLADALDKYFFWIYFVFCIAYFIGMFYVMVNYICIIDHFDFWE